MENQYRSQKQVSRLFSPWTFALCVAGLFINLFFTNIAILTGLPLYLDNIGSVLVAALGGALPGMAVGFFSNILGSFTEPISMYYGILTVIIAWHAAFFSQKGLFKKWKGLLLVIGCYVLIGGGIGSVMTWFLYGQQISGVAAPFAFKLQAAGLPAFLAQFCADVLVDVPDKAITVGAVALALHFYPKKLAGKFPCSELYDGTAPQPAADAAEKRYGHTLNTRLTYIVVAAIVAVSISAVAIGVVYHQRQMTINSESMAQVLSARVASVVDGDRVQAYLQQGEAAPGYAEAKAKMEEIYADAGVARYVYVYEITADDCRVVFDIDTSEAPGQPIGSSVQNDPDIFMRRAEFLTGGEVAPGKLNDEYGTLISAYSPVRNSRGETVAYAAVDIDKSVYVRNLLIYVIQVCSLLFAITLLAVFATMWFVTQHVTAPIQTILNHTESLKGVSPEDWLESDAWKNRAVLQTDDELEELYNSVTQAEERTAINVKKRLETEHRLVESRQLAEVNKKLEQAVHEAERANQAKSAFLSRMSHDMRTPLNGMLGLAALLQDTVKDEAALRDLHQMELSGQYLLNLINDTLDVSRIETGKLELHPTVCSGKELFGSVQALAKPTLQAKELQMEVVTNGLEYPMLYVDVGRVQQIMLNILGNAAKFTPRGGRVTCTMTHLSTENGVMTDLVSIQDTGIGISSEFLPHIFEPFSQEDSSKKNAREGTGLGMIITKQLVELMGGTISVKSQPGEGTCVTFTLVMPIATPQQVASWQAGEKEALQTDILAGKKVLLCEDHPLNAQIATRLLQKKGVEVDHAENGKVGLEKFAAAAPGTYNAVLMDVRMPVMDGLEATAAIRALPRPDAATIPIIAMTANAFEEDVQQTKSAGMNAHLSKPVSPVELYETLARLL